MRLQEVARSVRDAERRFQCGALLNATEIGDRFRDRKLSHDTSLYIKKRGAKDFSLSSAPELDGEKDKGTRRVRWEAEDIPKRAASPHLTHIPSFDSNVTGALKNCPGDDSLWQLLNQLRGRELQRKRNSNSTDDDDEFDPADELLRPIDDEL